ncbi:MAG: substrate-binding domain-containing protein, partial [Vallitaleaceae bacterium]|nr:substrate-binding domain-containing protein [Vallitaleaceae bacterium]
MKKIWVLMGLGFLVILVGMGFLIQNRIEDKSTLTKSNLYKEGQKPIVGFCLDSIVIERFQKDIDIFKNKAEELGFEVEVFNAYESNDNQVKQIRKLVEQGAVAICILAYDKDGLSEVIAEAKKKGVLIIAYDRLINNANVDAYVSFDNVKVGELMAKGLVEAVPKGNYVIINGSPLDHNSEMFNEGYYKVLQPYIDRGDIQVVEEVWAENWREEFAIESVSRLLSEGTELQAIIGANDRLAEGAISVLSEYELVGKVQVVGHDADISACQKIVEGKQLLTVYKPIKNLAQGSAQLIYDLLHEKAKAAEEKIFDGKYQVPFYKFDVIAVDASNMMDTVIKDQFH